MQPVVHGNCVPDCVSHPLSSQALPAVWNVCGPLLTSVESPCIIYCTLSVVTQFVTAVRLWKSLITYLMRISIFLIHFISFVCSNLSLFPLHISSTLCPTFSLCPLSSSITHSLEAKTYHLHKLFTTVDCWNSAHWTTDYIPRFLLHIFSSFVFLAFSTHFYRTTQLC